MWKSAIGARSAGVGMLQEQEEYHIMTRNVMGSKIVWAGVTYMYF